MKVTATVLLCISFSTGVFGAVPLPAESEKWLKVKSGNLEVYSNASPGQTAKISGELFRLRAAIASDLGVEIRDPFPTTVYLFRDEAAFAPYRDAAFLRRSSSISVAFFADESRNFAIVQADAAASSNRIVLRGLAEYFIRNSTPGLPLWLYEGLADYYSMFRGRDDEVIVGMPIPEYMQRLKTEKLSDLKSVDARTSRTSYDATAWLTAHYLISQKRLTAPEIATSDLSAYLAKLNATARAGGEIVAPQVAPRDEVLWVLGQLLALSGERAEADGKNFMREATRLNPQRAAQQLDSNSPAALTAFGAKFVTADGDVSAGIAALEKSLSLAPAQPRAAVYLAQLYAFTGRATELRRLFDTSLANSSDPEILRLGREALLIAEVKRAEDLLANGKDAEAQDLLRQVASQTTNAKLKTHIDQVLKKRSSIDQQLEVAQAAMAKANSGKYAEAVKMLDELLPQIEDADFKQRVQNLRAEFAKQR